jgi:peptide/nickel transport system ATP-binding protein
MSSMPLVEIEDLHVAFPREDGKRSEVVKGVSYSLGREKLGIVGESGSGKSLSARALMCVSPTHASVSA